MNSIYFPVLWLVIAALAVGIFAVTSGIGLYWQRLYNDEASRIAVEKQLLSLRRLRAMLYGITAILIAGGVATWGIERWKIREAFQAEIEALKDAWDKEKVWEQPDWSISERHPDAALIAYGRDLIVNTNDYFGPNGLVRPRSINNLNCQNCHLDAGTKTFGNNYSAVASTYPQLRGRSGKLETIPHRINDCFERSLDGEPLDTTSREMKAIVAYMEWLGTAVPKSEKPKGSGLAKLAYLDRAADPATGKVIFEQQCASCHGADGQGLPMPGSSRGYPPLWGPHSYNEAAGLFRVSTFAAYVKSNMPLGATHDNPMLTDEQAWDVAAFINSQPRPKHPFLGQDWPDIAKKPVDHPFGPFADPFPEEQHKYGPFGPIAEFYAGKTGK